MANPERLIQYMKHAGSRFAGSFGRGRSRRYMIATQVGVSLTLLVAVGLLLRSYTTLLQQDIGFDPERVITGHIWRPEGFSDDEITGAFDRVLEEIAALPNVELAAAASTIPMGPISTRVDPTTSYGYLGQPPLREGEEARVTIRTVTDDYFRVLGVPLRAGRFFDGRERTSATPNLIVNQALVDAIWPGEDAVGKELMLTRRGEIVAHTIVGVIADYRFDGLYAEIKPEVFLSMSQSVFGGASYVAKIRTDDDGATLRAMEAVASRYDNSMPLIEVHAMDDLVARTVAGQQALLTLLFGFAAFATILAGVGIYGLTSYLIGSRKHEIALRIALGADRAGIRTWVMRDALFPAAIGIVGGVFASLALARVFSGFLYGIDPRDGLAYAGALSVIIAVGIIAPVGPAARAAKVEASLALRPD